MHSSALFRIVTYPVTRALRQIRASCQAAWGSGKKWSVGLNRIRTDHRHHLSGSIKTRRRNATTTPSGHEQGAWSPVAIYTESPESDSLLQVSRVVAGAPPHRRELKVMASNSDIVQGVSFYLSTTCHSSTLTPLLCRRSNHILTLGSCSMPAEASTLTPSLVFGCTATAPTTSLCTPAPITPPRSGMRRDCRDQK